MKIALLPLLFALPLSVHAECPPGAGASFLSSHTPRPIACQQSKNTLCLDAPRLVDDSFHDLLVAVSTDFLPKLDAGRAPPDALVVVRDALRMDLTRRTAVVTCDGRHVYFHDQGGLDDRMQWSGPVAVGDLAAMRRNGKAASR